MATEIEEQLPLTEVTFFILLSLANEKKHGYAIMKDVVGLSEERLSLGTGTLYGALSRLLDQGWIECTAVQPKGRSRKTYRLSDLGRHILQAETRRLQELVQAARWRLTPGEI